MAVSPIAAGLGAAISFAIAAVLQQEATQATRPDASLTPRLLVDLLRRPKWLAGVMMLLAGFGCQALALANGPVALVQPIVATELAFAIPLAIWRRHRRPGRREWLGILGVLSGVSAFLVVASPESGTSEPAGADWILTLAPVGAVIAVTVGIAATTRGPYRATLLGAGAGLSFGLLAILTKSVTYELSTDVWAPFTSWQVYVLVVLGATALVVSQSAYQAGPLALSLPIIALLEPITAVLTGETLFDEQARLTGNALALEATAGLVAVLGIAILATSPTVLSIYQQSRCDLVLTTDADLEGEPRVGDSPTHPPRRSDPVERAQGRPVDPAASRFRPGAARRGGEGVLESAEARITPRPGPAPDRSTGARQ
jgi:drug/metabolite transporter (DMT)-like permease